MWSCQAASAGRSRAGRLPVSCAQHMPRKEPAMKLYDYAPAPSPRRVRIFLAEKGLSLPTIQINLREGEHLAEPFRAINPEMTVPVLELDDGRRLIDAIAICHYFERLH